MAQMLRMPLRRLLAALFTDWRAAFLHESGTKDPLEGKEALPSLKWRHLADVPVQLSKQGVVYHKSAASELDRVSAELIPHWVVNSVLQGQYTQPNSSKISFFLNPHPAGGMAPLPPGVNKLSSSKFLKVHKVAAYVASKLQSEGGEAEPELTLTCNDQLLPRTMSLASVQVFIWKSPGEDMQLQYRHGGTPSDA
uniref:Uncharacterized protein n=1 Tax=Haptolina ericina TaxID=156174 RepID=A0A7S3BWG9_9EUKA|mmetsp:Transcript_69918/g.155828  ORF Transcript_69918/g.155828 Transcript_69918/m.155828 type:complete len:195 (+) Transcript_69918:58-642(+)